jgi:signal transduction histidine kinase
MKYPLPMPLRRSLVFRLAAVFLGFVVVGSTALVAWLQFEETRESRAAFLATANANAQFVRSQRLPATERTAQALGEVLGVEVYFWHGGDPLMAVPDPMKRFGTREGKAFSEAMLLPAGTVRARHGGEAVRIPIDEQVSLLIFRLEPVAGGLWRSRTFAVLGVFWLLCLGLAWAMAGGIVGPLRRLAQRLPRIAEEGAEPELPEANRGDEIGQLARAYLETRGALAGERLARQQAERLATLGKMATGLAHEINNPVTAIKLHAQLLEGETSAPQVTRDSLGIIIAEAAKIEGLVSQWMFLARPQPPQTSRCDLAEIIAAAVRTHTPAAVHSGVRIVNQTVPGLWVDCDARRMSQAVGNLIINAIQAMAARGGTLTIRGGETKEARGSDERPTSNIQLPTSNAEVPAPGTGGLPLNCPHGTTAFSQSLESQLSTLNLHFTDTGRGFSEAALARYAELFFSEKEGGMGIGLSVTSEILRAHGGELRVANVSNPAGAQVTITLPRAANPQSAAERSETEPHSASPSQGSIRNPQ